MGEKHREMRKRTKRRKLQTKRRGEGQKGREKDG